jgi:acyl carrier protein
MNDKRDYSKEAIASWMKQAIASMLNVDEGLIELDVPFPEVGLDSADSVGLTGLLADWLHLSVDPEMAKDYPTITALAAHLEGVLRARDGVTEDR